MLGTVANFPTMQGCLADMHDILTTSPDHPWRAPLGYLLLPSWGLLCYLDHENSLSFEEGVHQGTEDICLLGHHDGGFDCQPWFDSWIDPSKGSWTKSWNEPLTDPYSDFRNGLMIFFHFLVFWGHQEGFWQFPTPYGGPPKEPLHKIPPDPSQPTHLLWWVESAFVTGLLEKLVCHE